MYQRQVITQHVRSELEAVVLAPLLHDLHEVFDLRVGRVLQHVDDLDEPLLVLDTCDDELEDTDSSATLALPEFRVSIEPLEHVEGLDREVELAHLVAIVGDEIEQGETLVRGLHVDVDVPGKVRFLVHDVAAAKPGQVTIVLLVALVLDL